MITHWYIHIECLLLFAHWDLISYFWTLFFFFSYFLVLTTCLRMIGNTSENLCKIKVVMHVFHFHAVLNIVEVLRISPITPIQVPFSSGMHLFGFAYQQFDFCLTIFRFGSNKAICITDSYIDILHYR